MHRGRRGVRGPGGSFAGPSFLIRLLAALLLSAIGWHAAPISDLPIRPEHGSAFSAATADVALAPRQEASAQQRVLPVPVPLQPQPATWVIGRASYIGTIHPPFVRARAPPPRERHGPQISPRAPPLT